MPAWVNLKLNVPPGEIVALSKAPLSLLTVCGAVVLFFQITMVPTVIFSVCGLNAKLPLLIIDTLTVVGGVGVGLGLGVGVGVALVGVGVSVVLVGVGIAFALVGVGLGFDCVGAAPGCVDVGEGVLFVVPTTAVAVLVDAGTFVAGLLLPPQPASTIRKATIQRQQRATQRGK